MKLNYRRYAALYAYAIVLPALLSASCAFAQEVRGVLHGRVVDPSGAVIPGAHVTVRNSAEKTILAETDDLGTYRISGLSPGRYEVSAVATNFSESKVEVEVTNGSDQPVNFELKVFVQQQVVVTDKPPDDESNRDGVSIDPSRNAGSLVLRGKDLDVLSDDPVDLAAELAELAGPSAGPDAGQFYIDGFSQGSIPPKSSIKEIRLNRNPFASEQDRLGYGRVEIITKPGLEQFHGQTSFIYSNSDLNARDPFILQKPDRISYLADGSFTGPLSKKASFVFNLQQRDVNDVAPINAEILDANLNPVPSSVSLPNPKLLTVINPRIDYKINSNQSLTVNYLLRRIKDRNDGIAPLDLATQAVDMNSQEHRLQITDIYSLSPTAENQARFQYAHTRFQNSAHSSDPEVQVTETFTSGGNPAGQTILTQNFYELQDHFLFVHGTHGLKFGGRFRATSIEFESTQDFNGTFIFDSLKRYQITLRGMQQGLTPAQIRAQGGGANQFLLLTGKRVTDTFVLDGSGYFQDDWRLHRGMMLSYGLRYEIQNNIHDYLDFAPRIGFAWALDGRDNKTPMTVLRAGAGIFYERIDSDLISSANRLNSINTRQFVVANPDFFPQVPPVSSLAAFVPAQASLSNGVVAKGAEGEESHGVVLPVTTQFDPNLRSPYAIQESVGIERQIKKGTTLAVSYLHSRGVRQLFTRNINAPLPGTFDPENPSSGVRPTGQQLNIYELQSHGTYKQSQMIANFAVRGNARFSVVGFYSLSFASASAIGASTFPSNQYDATGDYGRASFDRRHKIFMGAIVELPYKFRLNPILLAESGKPFNILLAQDLNGDSIFNDRPAFATNLSRPTVVRTQYGNFDTSPIPGQTLVPPYLETGPFLATLNLRISKTFSLWKKETAVKQATASRNAAKWNPRYDVTLNVFAQNLLNHVNAAPPISTLGSPLFGQSVAVAGAPYSAAAANRRINWQLVFSF